MQGASSRSYERVVELSEDIGACAYALAEIMGSQPERDRATAVLRSIPDADQLVESLRALGGRNPSKRTREAIAQLMSARDTVMAEHSRARLLERLTYLSVAR